MPACFNVAVYQLNREPAHPTPFFWPSSPRTASLREPSGLGVGGFSVARGGRAAASHGDLSQHLDKNTEREMTKLRFERKKKDELRAPSHIFLSCRYIL